MEASHSTVRTRAQARGEARVGAQRGAAREGQHLVPGRPQALDRGPADEPGGAHDRDRDRAVVRHPVLLVCSSCTHRGRGAPVTDPTAVRPRLLVLASTFPAEPGDGTPGFVADLAAVVARDYDTLVLTPRVPGSAARSRFGDVARDAASGSSRGRWEDLAHGAILENLRARRSRFLQVPFFLLFELLAVRRAVRTHRPDVVHVHWIVPQGLVALLGARGVPWLVTTLGGDVYALHDPVLRRAKSAVLRRARAVTTMNADMRDRLVALGADPARTHVLPMGADTAAVQEVADAQTRVPSTLLTVGRLVEKKGIGVLLEAVRALPPEVPWSLDVIGDGPLRASLQAQAAGLPVRFLGQATKAELSAAYGRCEVLVTASVTAASGDQDGLPVALLEAMSAGCAVVASRIAGIDAAIEDGRSGVLVPPGDVAALTAALTAVLADPERRARLGAAARERAEEFGVEHIGARYRALLDEVRCPPGT